LARATGVLVTPSQNEEYDETNQGETDKGANDTTDDTADVATTAGVLAVTARRKDVGIRWRGTTTR
jgi:hypothetical protein